MKRAAPIPGATLFLILCCIAVAFLVQFQPDMLEQLAFRKTSPSLLTAFASIFVHANLFHLLGNMVFLAAVGPAVEFGAGSLRFLTVFTLGGLAGVLAFWGLSGAGGNVAPLVGASGGIASCAAYYSVRYMRLRVPIAPKIGVPVVAVTGVWLVLQVIGATTSNAVPGVAYWAHVGGFAFGLILSAVFGAPRLADLEMGHEVLDRLNHRSPAARLAAANFQLELHPADTKALFLKADAYADLGDHTEEAETLVRILDVLPESEQPPVWTRLLNLKAAARIPSLKRVLLADRFGSIDPSVAIGLLESVANGPVEDPQRPDALLALVALTRDGKANQAAIWLKELLDVYPLHPAVELARQRGWVP